MKINDICATNVKYFPSIFSTFGFFKPLLHNTKQVDFWFILSIYKMLCFLNEVES